MKILLKGGRLVDPVNGRNGVFDLLIVDGRIAKVGRDLPDVRERGMEQM